MHAGGHDNQNVSLGNEHAVAEIVKKSVLGLWDIVNEPCTTRGPAVTAAVFVRHRLPAT